MTKNPERILVGRIWQECNTFNPSPSTDANFQIEEGGDLLEAVAEAGSTLRGIVDGLTDAGCSVIPSISVTAPPGGLVEPAFIEHVWRRLSHYVETENPDAIALEFHGAMGTLEVPDVEGELLTRLRRKVGPDMRIAVGLDLHAHVTNAMLESADICIACKENPHSDVVECGLRVAEILAKTVRGEVSPVTCMVKVPMVLPGNAETASGPLADLHANARNLQAGNAQILDVSLFNVFPYLDDHDMGQAVVITYDGYPETEDDALPIAEMFWERRREFEDDLCSITQGLDTVAARKAAGPFVLSDMGDRVMAGAPGDSVEILKAVLARQDHLTGAMSITDAEAVEIATATGIGNTITLNVGGKISPSFAPVQVTGRVISCSNGDFVISGPYQAGEKSCMGDSVVLLVDERIWLVLTTNPAFCHDPAVFTSQGIDLTILDFVVVKSGYHFKLNFAEIATPIVLRTPGISYYAPGNMPYKRANFWPENEAVSRSTHVRQFN